MSKQSREKYYRYKCHRLRRHDTAWENSHHDLHVNMKKFEDKSLASIEEEKQKLLEESEKLKEQFILEQKRLKILERRKNRINHLKNNN